MLALRDVDDTGEHQVIDPALGGFRQSYELWVCHAQLPAVELSEHELASLLTGTHPDWRVTEDGRETLTQRLASMRALSHLQWRWVAAPPERQVAGAPERYEARATIQGAHAADVWFRPPARVAGWVRDDTVPREGTTRQLTPVDAIGWYAGRAAYRGERWVFATGESPELARGAIDALVRDEVNKLRHLVADIDSRAAARTVQLEAQSRVPRALTVATPDGVFHPVSPSDPETRVGRVLVDAPVDWEWLQFARPARGQAVVAWAHSEPERVGWRALLDGTRTRVSAWVSRLHSRVTH